MRFPNYSGRAPRPLRLRARGGVLHRPNGPRIRGCCLRCLPRIRGCCPRCRVNLLCRHDVHRGSTCEHDGAPTSANRKRFGHTPTASRCRTTPTVAAPVDLVHAKAADVVASAGAVCDACPASAGAVSRSTLLLEARSCQHLPDLRIEPLRRDLVQVLVLHPEGHGQR